jgi:hypothetical protein
MSLPCERSGTMQRVAPTLIASEIGELTISELDSPVVVLTLTVLRRAVNTRQIR